MGIGFVLFFWGLLLGGAAVICAMVLGFWSWWNQRHVFGRGAVLKVVAAAVLPFLLLGYGGAAFAGYAIWCETIRGVDAGIGDGWRVPVGNDHYFCMIDVPEDGYLMKGVCSGAPIVHGRRSNRRQQQIERTVRSQHADWRASDVPQCGWRSRSDDTAARSTECRRLLRRSAVGTR